MLHKVGDQLASKCVHNMNAPHLKRHLMVIISQVSRATNSLSTELVFTLHNVLCTFFGHPRRGGNCAAKKQRKTCEQRNLKLGGLSALKCITLRRPQHTYVHDGRAHLCYTYDVCWVLGVLWLWYDCDIVYEMQLRRMLLARQSEFLVVEEYFFFAQDLPSQLMGCVMMCDVRLFRWFDSESTYPSVNQM